LKLSKPGRIRVFRLSCRKKHRSRLNAYYSIRINDQYRICFGWSEAGAIDVEIVDYHS
ncbi:type II toxin-antitoxin system RelE/ParE family toxin, partial [Chroococcidiopsis cubana]|uniref:type II toxin-antitoxin system RelE/ParE family toxin n=1 Tax=Chroococcidiopsis cubana TaxID=171392 RepID=UPI0018F58DF1